jgi:glutamyl-tRNA synthetase
MKEPRVRYGPSPTGTPHIGNIRTALFNYLFAKSQNNNGKFYLRIEDTDQARIVPGAVEKIKESLNALSIKWDDDVIVQSKRLPIYQKHLEVLKKNGLAYQDEGAWRFKIQTQETNINWQDVIHGTVSFPTNVFEDFIIIKTDGYPTYHFASVVDDHEMEITHVMRGDEWISSTPKHILLYKAFGWQHPLFVHLPPILGADHKKLSKREGAKSVLEYIEEGYLPEAIVNFLALLGWSPKGNQEIFSLKELCAEFTLDRINKNSPIFNIEKLDWFNGQWIRKMPDEDLIKSIHNTNPALDQQLISKVLEITKDRLSKITDFAQIARFFFEKPDLNNHIADISIPKNVFQELVSGLKTIDLWKEEKIFQVVAKIMEKEKLTKAQVYRSIGIALSGELVTPPIFASMEILGKEMTLERLNDATKKPKE